MLYQFKGIDKLSNTYLVCRFDACLLIDPSHSYEEIIDTLANRKLVGILLTHAHSNHLHLIHLFDAPIYIHYEDSGLLFDDNFNGYIKGERPYKRNDLNINIINKDMGINFVDQKVFVIHTPGHTKGSVSYLINNYLFTGDTLFKNRVGRYDLNGGSIYQMKSSISKLLDNLDSKITIYPGHGINSTINQERNNNLFYLKIRKNK